MDAQKFISEDENPFKVMSLFYNGYGMNITKIKGNPSIPGSYKALDKDWSHSLDDLFENSQSAYSLLMETWQQNTGIGLVLGWNNYHAIDVDHIGSTQFQCAPDLFPEYKKQIDELIKDFLIRLGLPENYPWVVISGSGTGFHIIFKAESLRTSFSSISYTPNLHYVYDRLNSERLFERLELRWRDHLVLPPSIHESGRKYRFWNCVPDKKPTMISLNAIDNLIMHYCGRVELKKYTYKGKEFTLAEYCKCYSEYDSWHYDHNVVEDSVEWLEKIDTSCALNSLALKYVLGKDVKTSNKAKALYYFKRADNDLSHFNLASLMACGYFNGTQFDVERCLNSVKDYRWLSYVEYDRYDETIPVKLFDQIRKNAESLNPGDMLLFIDTETTGLPRNYRAPTSALDNWPRLVQMCWILTTVDGQIVKQQKYIIRPNGFTIPSNSSSIHRITNTIAIQQGTEIDQVMKEFLEDVTNVRCIIGHNIEFDKHVVGSELIRLGYFDCLEGMNSYCTMKSTADFCKIPDDWGDYKYPKLQELYKKLFGRQFVNAHDAESDVKATMECFFELIDRKIISENMMSIISPNEKDEEKKQQEKQIVASTGVQCLARFLNEMDSDIDFIQKEDGKIVAILKRTNEEIEIEQQSQDQIRENGIGCMSDYEISDANIIRIRNRNTIFCKINR